MSKKKLSVYDRVTIYRKVKKDYWINDSMDKFVGKSGVIVDFDGNAVKVDLDGNYLDWWFPKASIKREVK